MDASFTGKFVKQFNKLPDKSQWQFHNRLKLFLTDQHYVLLCRHALKGKYAGYYSINTSSDLRAVFRYQLKNSVIFSLIGTHSQLY